VITGMFASNFIIHHSDDCGHTARACAALLGIAMIGGLAIDFVGLDAVKMMFWSAVVNGACSATHPPRDPSDEQPACYGRTRQFCSAAHSWMDRLRGDERRYGRHAGELNAGKPGPGAS
jgi:hypothetical protein